MIVMSDKILDTPFTDSFQDFLHKDEIIQWEMTLDEKIQTPIFFNDEGRWSFNYQLLLWPFGVASALSILFYFLNPQMEDRFILIVPYIFMIFSLPRAYRIYGTEIHSTKYAITNKRILFRLSHLPKNKIHEIPFSQINNCIVTIAKGNIGTIFLAVKNPQLIPFETYTFLDNDAREKRHQPTLESVEDVNKIAELIRKGIENQNRLL